MLTLNFFLISQVLTKIFLFHRCQLMHFQTQVMRQRHNLSNDTLSFRHFQSIFDTGFSDLGLSAGQSLYFVLGQKSFTVCVYELVLMPHKACIHMQSTSRISFKGFIY